MQCMSWWGPKHPSSWTGPVSMWQPLRGNQAFALLPRIEILLTNQLSTPILRSLCGISSRRQHMFRHPRIIKSHGYAEIGSGWSTVLYRVDNSSFILCMFVQESLLRTGDCPSRGAGVNHTVAWPSDTLPLRIRIVVSMNFPNPSQGTIRSLFQDANHQR